MTQPAVDIVAVDAGRTPNSVVLLASAARTIDPTSVQFGVARGVRALEVVLNVSAIGNGHSYVQGAAVTLPLVVVAGVNDQFKFNTDEFTIAAGTYNTLAALATAVGAATKTGPVAFSTLVTVTASGTGLLFTNVASGVHAEAFASGTHNVLSSLGITNGWTIAHTQPAGADGVAAVVATVQGVTKLGATFDLLASASITGTGSTRLLVRPGITVTPNVAASDIVPELVRVTFVHATDNPVTYTAEAIETT